MVSLCVLSEPPNPVSLRRGRCVWVQEKGEKLGWLNVQIDWKQYWNAGRQERDRRVDGGLRWIGGAPQIVR